MSFAHNDIDAQIAQMIAPEAPAQATAPQTKVLVVSQSRALGQAMLSEMAQDDTVDGTVVYGNLTQIVDQSAQDWTSIQFVVFEISSDLQKDVQALNLLQSVVSHEMSFVAMSSQPVDPAHVHALELAGVRELLTINAPPEEAAVPQTEDVADTAEPAQSPLVSDAGHSSAGTVESVPVAAQAMPSQPVTPDVAAVPLVPAQTNMPTPEVEANDNKTGKVTVILRARGGAGASTLAVNLAVAAAAENGAGRTALIDFDIQNAAVSLMLDMPESSAATELVKGTHHPDAGFVERAMVRHQSGVDVLAAPDVFAPLTALTPETVAALLETLQARYDNIIIDMPQGIVDWIDPIFAHATRVLLISDTSLPAVKRTRRLLGLIEEDHMTLPVEVVINQHRRPLVMSATLKEVENLIGRPLKHWIPMDIKAVRRATDMGQPLRSSAKRSAATRAIDQLAQHLFASAGEG